MPDHDPQMLKGALRLLLLQLVSEQEDYGYSIVVRLHEHGFRDLAEGTVYPALSRLESQGLLEARLVKSAAGPARKYYRTTPTGDEERARARLMWHTLVDAVAGIVPPPPAAGTTRTPDDENARERTAR